MNSVLLHVYCMHPNENFLYYTMVYYSKFYYAKLYYMKSIFLQKLNSLKYLLSFKKLQFVIFILIYVLEYHFNTRKTSYGDNTVILLKIEIPFAKTF